MSNLPAVEKPKPVSIEEKKNTLQSALYYLTQRNPFLGAMLQELTVKYTTKIPTAAISYNKKFKQFEILLNEHFFCVLGLDQRIAILTHEILHFLHQHLFRLPFASENVTEEEKMIFNMAGDMAINQLINNLPDDCVDVRKWVTSTGQPFPTLRSMEEYYDLIKKNAKANQNKMPKPAEYGQYEYQDGGRPLDQHIWEGMTPEEKEEFMGASKKLIERTMEKTSFSFTDLPGYIKELIEKVDIELAEINYKRILKEAIKKNASCADRESTWNKPNKRYGAYCQGTRLGKLPKLNMYVDTSGSISHRELNEFLGIMDKFLKVGVRTCTLGLWHTNMYYKKPYKYGQQLNVEDVESGGTELSDVLRDINKFTPDLSIILTDGYYGIPEVKPKGEIVWIISKGGDMNHPMKHIGKTISLDKIKGD